MLVSPTIAQFVGHANSVTVIAVEQIPERLAGKPTWLVTQLATYARRLVADAHEGLSAGMHHYRILAALAEFGPMSQADLSRRGNLDRSDVVAAVNELAGQGFVERQVDPQDKRRNVIQLTRAGTNQLRRLDTALNRVQDELLTPLTAAERTELVDLLARLLDHQRQG
jgi:DNA-binding MarR family transcriptional regulator